MSRRKRPTIEYIEASKRLAKFAPSLNKYKRRKKLSSHEKAAIARKEKILKYHDHLIPVSKKIARELKEQMFAPGIQAIQLRNTSPHAKIKKIGRDMLVTSNGRSFIYWRLGIRGERAVTERQALTLNKRSQRLLQEAAKKSFYANEGEGIRGVFPIEQIADLAQRAFKKFKVTQIFLWAEAGRVGEGFRNFDEFVQWLYESYSQYKNVERWVNGVVIQV